MDRCFQWPLRKLHLICQMCALALQSNAIFVECVATVFNFLYYLNLSYQSVTLLIRSNMILFSY